MREQYEKDKYILVRQFIPEHLVSYLREYFNTLSLSGRLKNGDGQVERSECVYGDPAYDTFLLMSTPIVSQIVGLDLFPTYTYARIYHNGAELLPHKDRSECEHSCTLSLGGEYDAIWPIWVKDESKENSEPIMIDLHPGDLLVYQGTDLVHWRDPFDGNKQYQLFMHYVNRNGQYSDKLYDGRAYIGMQK
jgi:hypothetical protein